MTVAVAASLLLGGAQAAAAGQRGAAGKPGWRAVQVLRETGKFVEFAGVTAIGARTAFAGGETGSDSANSRLAPLIERWNGSAWSALIPPHALASRLKLPVIGSISALSRSDLWAFTAFGQGLHLQGSAWSAVSLPGRTRETGQLLIQASLAAGRRTVWAFGGVRAKLPGPARPYVAVRTGSRGWRRVPLPGRGQIAAASAVGAHDIWAVLGNGVFGSALELGSPGGLLHWKGGRWERVTLPAPLRNGSLGAILARSDRDVWVGGAVRNSRGGTTEAIGHWNGHGWTVQVLRGAASKRRFWIGSITGDGSGGLWALGICASGICSIGPGVTRLWHYSAGRWSRPVQVSVAGKAAVLIGLASAGRAVWAAGGLATNHGGSSEGLIARWGVSP